MKYNFFQKKIIKYVFNLLYLEACEEQGGKDGLLIAPDKLEAIQDLKHWFFDRISIPIGGKP